ncbi:MAG: hypothetical protein ACRDGS_02775, partial [Chloroflexota bacterium]
LGSLRPDVAVYTQGTGTQGSRGRVGPKWSVYISISKSKGNNTLPASIRVDHLGKGLRAILGTPWLQVYVDAPYLDIAKLPPLVAHINATGLVQGVYELKPVLSLPPSLGNYSITPNTVKVTITK